MDMTIEWEIEKQARKFIPHNEPLSHTIILNDFNWPKVKKAQKYISKELYIR